MSRAFNENKDWALYGAIRRQPQGWQIRVLDSIRGRKNAYALEREWIADVQPSLNEA